MNDEALNYIRKEGHECAFSPTNNFSAAVMIGLKSILKELPVKFVALEHSYRNEAKKLKLKEGG